MKFGCLYHSLITPWCGCPSGLSHSPLSSVNTPNGTDDEIGDQQGHQAITTSILHSPVLKTQEAPESINSIRPTPPNDTNDEISNQAGHQAITASFLTSPVLTTPEVLEMILLQTDMRTLVTSCQRVCRAWRNLITKSSSIQKSLFFTPIKESEWGTQVIHNTLLAEKFPTIFPADLDLDDCDLDPNDRKLDFFSCAMAKDPASLDRFVRKDASWRRMLVQQPLISEIGLFHVTSGRGGDVACCTTIPANPIKQDHRDEGLRMGRLFEILLFDSPNWNGMPRPTRVYWSSDEPIDFHSRQETNIDAFHQILSQSYLVIHTSYVAQCGKGLPGCLSGRKWTQEKIIEAYQEHGFDVDSQGKEMEAYRKSAKRIKWGDSESESDGGDSE